jgi:hypothetical protein
MTSPPGRTSRRRTSGTDSGTGLRDASRAYNDGLGSRDRQGHVSGGETLVGWLIVVIIVLVIIGAVTVIRKVL